MEAHAVYGWEDVINSILLNYTLAIIKVFRMEISANAKAILSEGRARIRVKRAGMFQYMVFRVKRIRIGADEFVELYSERMLDASELARVANETGLPVEAEGHKAFPEGTGAKDFIGL